ncbi:MAG: protein kinase [Acidobacteria bacterium]|nr:protein kinase [Acidobacteriota bacterium]
MTDPLYARARSIVASALERAPAERAAYVSSACGGDEALRREVASWLDASDRAGSFLESSAVKLCSSCSTLVPDRQSFCPHCGQAVVADPKALVGTRLDNLYQIESLLGTGGMGAVYRARHVLLGDTVAIKTLKTELASDPGFLKRFQREGRAARAFRHPNAVAVHDLRSAPSGLVYMVLEFVEGGTLRDEMSRRGPFAPAEAVEVLAPLASVLDAAHAKGVVHRDLKPENVMLARDESGLAVVKLLDLGIARFIAPDDDDPSANMTIAGQALGTPPYMSPEHWGEPPRDGGPLVDRRADVYSLAVMAFELVAGRTPFVATGAGFELSLARMRRAHTSEMPPQLTAIAPGVPEAFARAVARGLSKDRSGRQASAGEFAAELASSLGELAASGQVTEEFDVSRDPRATVLRGSIAPDVPVQPPSARTALDSRPVADHPALTAVEAPDSRSAPRGRPAFGLALATVVLIGGIAGIAALGAWQAGLFGSTPQGAAASAPAAPEPAATPKAPATVGYSIEVRGLAGAWPANTPLPDGAGFRIRIESGFEGRVYVLGPDANQVMTGLLTGSDASRTGPGTTVEFPSTEWIFPEPGTRSDRLIVVVAPGETPPIDELGRPSGSRLTPAESAALDAFVAENRAGSSEPMETGVRVTPREAGAPVALDLLISYAPHGGGK